MLKPTSLPFALCVPLASFLLSTTESPTVPTITATDTEHGQGAQPETDDDDSDSDDDSDVDADGRDPKAEEVERLRVLEAAGLLRRSSASGEASTKRRRRAAPARPDHVSRFAWDADDSAQISQAAGDPGSALVDDHRQEEAHAERMEDAYDVRLTLSGRSR